MKNADIITKEKVQNQIKENNESRLAVVLACIVLTVLVAYLNG